MSRGSCCLVLVGFATIVSAAGPGVPGTPKRPLRLEVEVERGGQVDRLTVYVCNDTKESLVFHTGSRGGGGSLDDRVKGTTGTLPTVIPELTFTDGEKETTLRAPALGGPTRRSMQPAKLTVRPGERLRYASWAVPHAQAAGRLSMARLVLPDKQEILGGEICDLPLIERKPDK